MRSFAICLLVVGLHLVSALPYRGADFSSLLVLEQTGVKYYASSTAASQPLEQILASFGVNLARIRVWISGPYDLKYGLALAKRAKAVGMDIFVDLHYSDTWADPGHQTIPSSWPTDLKGLTSQVYHYTYSVVEAFNAQGTPIHLIQLGNEINDGLLWPAGRITVNDFDAASKILHAGALAVRKASPTTKTAIHMATGWQKDDVSWLFHGIFTSRTERGVGGGLTQWDVDIIALSFYPYYGTGATFSNLQSSLDWIVSTLDKDIMVVETGWPEQCDTTTTPLSEPTIPVSAEGQIEWIADIKTVLNRYGDKGQGIVYWEPGWIGNGALGTNCSDILLVDSDGVARESMTMFSNM